MKLLKLGQSLLDKLKLLALYCAPGVMPTTKYLTSKEDKAPPSREELELEIILLKKELIEVREKQKLP